MVSSVRQRLLGNAGFARFAAWAILPACILVYIWARVSGSPAADAVRVFAFVVPIALAALGSLLSWFYSPPGRPWRLGWGIVAIATALVLSSEVYYGAYQLKVDMGGPPLPSAFDVLNLAAAAVFFALWGSMTQTPLATPLSRARALAGAVVFCTAWYVAVYHWVAEPLASASGHASTDAAVWAGYFAIGSALLAGCAWAVYGHRRFPWVMWQVLAAIALSAFAVAVFLWPTSHIGSLPSGEGVGAVLLGAAYMAGYHVFFMASVYWLTAGEDAWTMPKGFRPRAMRESTSLVVTTVGVAALPALILAFHRTAPDSFDRGLYFAALAITTIAVVLRTSLTDVESMGVRARASADPLTSVWNRTAFEGELREAIAKAEAHDGAVTLAVLDIDDFARFNVVHGREEGDQALVTIAHALREGAGADGSVARLGGDEFAVIFEGLSTANARSRVRHAVHTVETSLRDPEPITLSAGTASWPHDAPTAEELVSAADAALYWAKYQGKHRVEAFNETVIRAIDAKERARGIARKSHSDIVRALAAATDARDSATAYHSRQVAALAFLVAEATGLGSQRVQDLQMAALLHDVGKVAVPDSVLRKHSRLSPGERAVLMEHAELGARILSGTELAYMAPWVRAHHERWDGSGYPDGIAGPAIPLEARIIAACDLFDRMVSGTPERGPLSRSAAIQELDQSMGRSLDPDVAEILIEVVSQGQHVGWSEAWL